MSKKKSIAVALTALILSALAENCHAALSFYVDPGSPWPAGWYNAAVANMQTVVNMYNSYGDFGNGSIYVYYNAGIPTAQSGYGGSGGSIGDGGTYPNVRVLLHESSHWLGTGTYSANWTGSHASALIQQFDGVGAVLNGDTQHYWPYGENYDNESSTINDARHVAMVYALREDFGIGSTAPPSSATNVTLTASDATDTSGFNYPFGWSDGHFPQAGTNYSTGDNALRTPNGYPSWTFAGASLTVNNHTNPNGGLLFDGYGTTGIVTINNLILDGGTIKHDQFAQDLFQLAGKVTLASTSTINAAQGNIKLLADIGGSGSLIKAGANTLTLTGAGNYTGNTTISAGTLQLASVAPIASYTFDSVTGSTVSNTGTGGTGMNGTLAGGATIVAGGRFGNAVSLSNGASVNINNPITDLGNASSWTVSAWVKTTTAGSSILTKGDGSTWTTGNTILYMGDGTAGGSGGIPSAVRYAGGFYQGAANATAVNNNAWHQVTYVNSGGTYGIYVDGVMQSLSSNNSSFGNADIGSIVRLGVSTNNVAADGTVNFNGLLDNVQFYNSALTQSQISALYQGNNPVGSLPSSSNLSIASGAKFDLNGATQQIGSLSGSTGSTIALGNGRLTVGSVGNTQFDGVITGAGGSFVKQGAGTLTLTGVNNYTGSTTINAGVLKLDKLAASAITNSGIANYSFDNVSGSTVTNNGTGGSAMNGALTGGATIVAGGHSGNAVSLAGGASVNINNPITDLSNTAAWTVSAWIKTTTSGGTILSKSDGGWGSGNSIFYLGDGTAGGSGGVPSAVRYAGGFFQGSTAATSVINNAWHQVTYINNAGSYAIYVDGVLQPLSSGNSGFSNADIGSIVRLGVTTDAVAGDGTVNFNGLLDDVQVYNYALTTAQIAAISQGMSIGSLPTTTDVSIAAGATLDLNNLTQQIASLSGAAGSNVVLGAGQLVVNSTSSTQFAGTISGTGGALVKQGSGTLTLSGTNTFTGPTSVSTGTLRVNGSLTSAVTVYSGAVLSGSGNISGAVAVASGGTLAPGNSPGTLSVGSLNLNAGSLTQIELGGTTRGSQYDAILSSGNVTVGGTLQVSLINGFSPARLNRFDILDWGTRSGTFSTLQLPALSGSLGWNTSNLYSTGELSVVDLNLLPGDLNLDHQVTTADLPLLMLALTNKADYELQTGISDAQLQVIGDADESGTFDNSDLQGFLNELLNGASFIVGSAPPLDGWLAIAAQPSVPEPSSIVIACIAVAAAISFRAQLLKRST